MYSFSSSLNNPILQKEITKTRAYHCKSNKAMFKMVANQSSSNTQQIESPPSIIILPKTMKRIAQQSKATLSSSIAYFLTTVNNFIDSPLHPSVDPNLVLVGNFSPVDETPPTKCLEVEGKLPHSLRGTYIRNGPNPQHEPQGPFHFFDGDGMLHSVRLSDGHATFCSRYVNTHKYKMERDAGVPVMPNFFAGFYCLAHLGSMMRMLGRAMVGQLSMFQGFGLANTSVTLLHDNVFAMHEMDLPYAIKLTPEGDIKTMGRWDFAAKAPASMTAHPKVDLETGEVFAFRWAPPFPYLIFFSLDSNGAKKQDVPIHSLNHYVHDFAVTKHFAVFPETQLEIATMNMMLCKGTPLRYKPHKVPRIGVIPRYPDSGEEMRWFPVPGFNALHIVNAWEDDKDGLVIISPNAGASLEDFATSTDNVCCNLEKLRIDLRNNTVSRTVLTEKNVEFGSTNPGYYGRKNRYVYMAVAGKGAKMSGVVKIDLELGCEVANRSHGPGCFGGEALFVPKDGNDSTGEEDDGFLVLYVHDETTQVSKFVVLDAKSPTLEVLAAVKLPTRVPYGIHGLFVGEKALKAVTTPQNPES